MIYPPNKRLALLSLLNDNWSSSSPKSERQAATLLEHLRTAACILLLESYFSIQLEQWLNSLPSNLHGLHFRRFLSVESGESNLALTSVLLYSTLRGEGSRSSSSNVPLPQLGSNMESIHRSASSSSASRHIFHRRVLRGPRRLVQTIRF